MGGPRTLAEKQQSLRWIEQSVVRRMAGSIKNTVQDAVQHSPFLVSTPPVRETAVFHRAEINTAKFPIGSGGFSTVYEIVSVSLNPTICERCTEQQRLLREEFAETVLDENGKSNYVIKLLSRKLLSNPKFFGAGARDLAMEAEYMTRLDHPNILSIHALPIEGLDSFMSGDCESFFIITERLEKPLNTAVKEWGTGIAPSLEKRVVYALSIAKAIEYLHSKRIVFRDLKPANIGISTEDEIKVFDFGLCREVPFTGDPNVLSFNMSWVGTQRYMSSEVLEQGKYNVKADVYSWALVTWEILTGCQPYNGYGKQKHLVAVLQNEERPFLIQTWPERLKKTLSQSWCRSVQDRFSMSDAIRTLERTQEIPPVPKKTIVRSEPLLFQNRTNLIATRSGAVSMASRKALYSMPRVSTIHISVF